MPFSYDTEELIKNVERTCSVPLTQITYEPLDIVSFANSTLQSTIVPLIMKSREEYFVVSVDVTPDSDGIIPIPSDAIGAKLEYVMAISNECEVKIPRMDLGVIASYGNNFTFGFAGPNNTVGVGGFYVKDNSIHLYPKTLLNTYNQTLRLYYFKRLLDLAEPDAYGKIMSIDYNNNSVDLENVPLDWTVGTELNIQQGTPHFKNLVPTIEVVSLSAPTVNLSGSIADVSVGDYVCAKGFAACPQILVEAYDYLVQLTSLKCMQGMGNESAIKNLTPDAEMLKNDLVGLISNRVEGQPKKIVNTNRFGRGWRSRFGRY